MKNIIDQMHVSILCIQNLEILTNHKVSKAAQPITYDDIGLLYNYRSMKVKFY